MEWPCFCLAPPQPRRCLVQLLFVVLWELFSSGCCWISTQLFFQEFASKFRSEIGLLYPAKMSFKSEGSFICNIPQIGNIPDVPSQVNGLTNSGYLCKGIQPSSTTDWLLIPETTWTNLKTITLSERSQIISVCVRWSHSYKTP